MKGWATRTSGMPSPDQILDQAPTKTREVRIEANVLAYFGNLFLGWKEMAKSIKTKPNS